MYRAYPHADHIQPQSKFKSIYAIQHAQYNFKHPNSTPPQINPRFSIEKVTPTAGHAGGCICKIYNIIHSKTNRTS